MRVRARNYTPHISGQMNKLEEKYATHLAERKMVGEIRDFRFESFKLRLADKTFYTPDFAIVTSDGLMEFHETKGFWEEDARIKIKVAAAQYREFGFVGVKWSKQQGWQLEEF